jgi:hypothetical protein
MPSAAFLRWQNERMPRLAEVDAQCAKTFVPVPPPDLADENLRAYVMLLSAHFQGFCRDLCTECAQLVAAAAPPAMRDMIQTQCAARLLLDTGNPSFESIRGDFERFGFGLNAELKIDAAMAAANEPRITHIGHLNLWRNYVAHSGMLPPAAGGPFHLATVQAWKNSCDEFAAELDRIMYNQLQRIIGAAPW